jgi:NTE family protein
MRINAVFQGGGVRAIAHVGALQRVEAEPNVEIVRVGGTSAGAIVAALYAAGYEAHELCKLIPELLATASPASAKPWTKLWRFCTFWWQFGMHPTRRLCDRIHDLLLERGVTRFSELERPCRIVTANVTSRTSKVFGATDEVDVAEAVRMSISIPFFFRPYRLGERYFVDGGIVSNYPLWIFEDDELPTIGFRLESRFQRGRKRISNIRRFVGAVIATACEAGDRDERAFPRNFRSVSIDTKDVRTTDFRLDGHEVEGLLAAGRAAASTIDWDAIPDAKKLEFADPMADLVLDRTVSSLHRILGEARYSRGKRFRKYGVRYEIRPDGSAEIAREFELVAEGEHPLSCMVVTAHGGSEPAHLSFHDLNVKAEDLTGGPCRVAVVPARNTASEKHIGLFFLPAVVPGETRRVKVTQTYPGCFRKLLAYRPDEIGVHLKEPAEELTVWLQYDRSLGKIRFTPPYGLSAALVHREPVRPFGDMLLHAWTIKAVPAPKEIGFKVGLTRLEKRAVC